MNSKILGSIMVMGIAIMMAGVGAMAVFSDTEKSLGNTFAAGEMDLKMDANSYYYREGEEPYDTITLAENDYGNIEAGQDPGVVFNWTDVKPGDWGWAEISLHVYDNPAHIWMTMTNLVDNEVSVNEPELEAGDDNMEVSTEGELSQYIEVTVLDWGDVELWSGTLFDLYEVVGDVYLGVLENCNTEWITIEWEVPLSVGNIIQSDSVMFDIEFYAEQERNNPVNGE